MSYFEQYLKFTRIKKNALDSLIASFHSFTKIIFISVFFTLFSGCVISKGKISVTLNNKKTDSLNVSVTNVQVINHQLIVTGTGLNGVTDFKIKDGTSTTDLQIESKSNTSIVANTLSNVSFAVGTIFDFVLSNANAASTFQVTFVNSNNSITAAMLTSMGATKGQVMKYNGASWVASSITNAQTYLGTWNATSNTPDLTIPSSTPGDYYIVSVAGTFELVPYAVGDWIISDGYNWQKVANSAVVVSTFNGRRGIVTLVPGDYVSLRNGSGKLPGSSLNDLDDLNIVTPANGSVLKYDTATSKWIVGVDNSGAGAYAGTANRAVATDGAGALTTSTTTAAELGYVAGVTSSIQTQLGAKLGTALASTNIFVGNGSAVATAVAMSGDATLSNAGVLTLKNTGTAGTYTSVTTDAQGRVTSGSNPAVAAITALTGDVTASGTGSVAATIAANAVTTGKINDGTILPADLDFTGTNIGTSGLVIRNLTGGFTPLVCSTVGYVPTWTVTGFICQASTAGSLSTLTAATTTNTIDNSNFAQIWNWTTATTQSLMTFASNAMTTGSILNLTTSSGSVNSTNGLLNVANTGASTSGVLARFQANSTAGSGMTMLTNGNVGIGTSSPSTTLDVIGNFSVGGTFGFTNTVSASSTSAFGMSNVASANASSAFGFLSTSSGVNSFSANTNGIASGNNSAAFGDGNLATSKNHFAVGANGLNLGGSATTWVATDPLFTIGNGSLNTSRSNAMTVLKNGNVGIGTTTPSTRLEVNKTSSTNVESDVAFFYQYANPPAGATSTYRASYLNSYYDGGASPSAHVKGQEIYTQIIGNASTLSTLSGSHVRAALASGNATTIYGVRSHVSSTSSLASVTDVFGIHSKVDFSAGGYTNGYGLYLDTVTGGTNNWALYSASASSSYFGGNVGVGTTAPGYKLHVVGAGGATVGYFSDGTATCSITPATAGNISCSSDERLKKNIEFFSDLRSLDKILKLKTVTYEWKDIDNGRHTGYIAQDVEKIAPEFVINGKDGFKQVSYAGFIPWITGAIKALYGEFKIVVTRVLSLEEKDAMKERAIALINANAVKLESDNVILKKKFEAENITLKKKFEAENLALKKKFEVENLALKKKFDDLKKENELMKAKLDKIEKIIEKSKYLQN